MSSTGESRGVLERPIVYTTHVLFLRRVKTTTDDTYQVKWLPLAPHPRGFSLVDDKSQNAYRSLW
jgi:hypothetical protein